jgi:hypothetical protein
MTMTPKQIEHHLAEHSGCDPFFSCVLDALLEIVALAAYDEKLKIYFDERPKLAVTLVGLVRTSLLKAIVDDELRRADLGSVN